MTARDIIMSAGGASAPITFVGSASTQNTSNSTTLVINKPAGTADGDLMFFMASADAAGADAMTWTVPSGWTEVYDHGDRTALCIGYKIASSEGSSYTFTASIATRKLSGHIVTYRNAAPGFKGAASQVTDGDPVCGGVTIPTAGSLILAALSNRNETSITWSPPSGFSTVVADSDATHLPSNAIFSYPNPAVGATGTQTFTSTAGDAVGILFFLTPSSYTAPTPTFVASASTQNTSNSTTLVINKPAGTVDGDLMLAFMANAEGASRTWTGDTGWTEVADESTGPNIRIAYKIASSEGSGYTFTCSATEMLAGSILTYRAAAYDAIGAFVSGSNPLFPTGPTAALNYSRLIAFAVNDNNNTTITGPGSMTTRITDNDSDAPSYAIFDEIVGAGATGTRSFTVGGGAGNKAAIMLTIKPA